MASLSAPLGRRSGSGPTRRPAGGTPRDDGRPGLLLFDRDGGLRSANQEVRAWLAELSHDQDLPSDLGVGVASRGELVAKLFADWCEPIHLQDVVRVSDN